MARRTPAQEIAFHIRYSARGLGAAAVYAYDKIHSAVLQSSHGSSRPPNYLLFTEIPIFPPCLPTAVFLFGALHDILDRCPPRSGHRPEPEQGYASSASI